MAKKDDAMMNTLLRRTVAAVTLAGSALLLGACSELKTDLPAPGAEKGVHEVGWDDPAASAFHGKVLKVGSYDFDACVTCHAKALNGGTSKTSCYTCHTSYPLKIGWTDTSATQFHGKFLRLGMDRPVSRLPLRNPGVKRDLQITRAGNFWVSAGSSRAQYLQIRNFAHPQCPCCLASGMPPDSQR